MLAPAFENPVLALQSVFRATMNAMARPGVIHDIDAVISAPAPLSKGAAAIALSLFDYETPVWLDASLSDSDAVVRWLRFHTGAPVTHDPGNAAFALIGDPVLEMNFSKFARGTAEYPDRSTTLIIQVESLSDGEQFRLSGPGIRSVRGVAMKPEMDCLPSLSAENGDLFPRGIDLLLATDGAVMAIPRTTRMTKGD